MNNSTHPLAKKQPARPLTQAHSSSLRGALAALERAFAAAQQTAAQTNTLLVVQQNGKLVQLKVK